MIVGVGIFGIPFVTAQAGFLVGLFYLVLMTGVLVLIHLFYGEISLRTADDHGLVGYASKYLGPAGKKFVGVIIVFEFYGALLAYIIAGGKFLNIIFSRFLGGDEAVWALVFFAIGSLIVLFGLKAVGSSELFMAFFLIVIAAIFIFKGIPLAKISNLPSVNWANFFLPYGVVLFALTGGAAIPEIKQILKGQEHQLKKIIILGTVVPAVIYALFAFSVVGVTGEATSQDAITGLVPHFGTRVILLGAVFGFLTVISSYLVIASNLGRIFSIDFGIKRSLSMFLVFSVPIFAYFFLISDFVLVIALVGSIAGGFEGIVTILIYRRAKKLGDRQPEYNLQLNRIFIFGLILLFTLGIIYQFVYLAK